MAGSAQSSVAWHNDMEILGSSEMAASTTLCLTSLWASSSSHTLQRMNHTSETAV